MRIGIVLGGQSNMSGRVYDAVDQESGWITECSTLGAGLSESSPSLYLHRDVDTTKPPGLSPMNSMIPSLAESLSFKDCKFLLAPVTKLLLRSHSRVCHRRDSIVILAGGKASLASSEGVLRQETHRRNRFRRRWSRLLTFADLVPR